MKNITIVIPTRNRAEKLKKVIDSIPEKPYISIWVVFDDDAKTFFNFNYRKNVKLFLTRAHIGTVACRNLVSPFVEDGFLYACDDTTFEPNAVETALKEYNQKFKDDGILGFNILGVNGTGHPSGVALVGQKFLQRYPDKRMFCPQFWTFSCQEVKEYAVSLGKFYLSSEAAVFHAHPLFGHCRVDSTHNDARKYKNKDMALIAKRKKEKLIWGLNDRDYDKEVYKEYENTLAIRISGGHK